MHQNKLIFKNLRNTQQKCSPFLCKPFSVFPTNTFLLLLSLFKHLYLSMCLCLFILCLFHLSLPYVVSVTLGSKFQLLRNKNLMGQLGSIGPTWNMQLWPGVNHMILVAIPEHVWGRRSCYTSIARQHVSMTLKLSQGLYAPGVLHFQVVPSQSPCWALSSLTLNAGDCQDSLQGPLLLSPWHSPLGNSILSQGYNEQFSGIYT